MRNFAENFELKQDIMKHFILTALLCFAGVLCLQAQSQPEEQPKLNVYRNQILIAPFYFFDNTFMISYERVFPSNGALRITPSITLSNINSSSYSYTTPKYESREGVGLDLGYKAIVLDKSKKAATFNVYIGPYAMYKHVNNSKFDEATQAYRADQYDILGLGIDSGLKLIFGGRFVLDVTLGGGVRYPLFDSNDKRVVTDTFDDEFKGVIPRINLFLGVTL